MRRQEAQPLRRQPRQLHRRRELAQQRRHRRTGDINELETIFRLRRQQNASALDRVRISVQPRREFLAIAVQQTHGNRV